MYTGLSHCSSSSTAIDTNSQVNSCCNQHNMASGIAKWRRHSELEGEKFIDAFNCPCLHAFSFPHASVSNFYCYNGLSSCLVPPVTGFKLSNR